MTLSETPCVLRNSCSLPPLYPESKDSYGTGFVRTWFLLRRRVQVPLSPRLVWFFGRALFSLVLWPCPAGYVCGPGVTDEFGGERCGGPQWYCPEGSQDWLEVGEGNYSVGGSPNGRIAQVSEMYSTSRHTLALYQRLLLLEDFHATRQFPYRVLGSMISVTEGYRWIDSDLGSTIRSLNPRRTHQHQNNVWHHPPPSTALPIDRLGKQYAPATDVFILSSCPRAVL